MQTTRSVRWLSLGSTTVVAAGLFAACAPAVPATTVPGVVVGPSTTTAPNSARGAAGGQNENIRVAAGANATVPQTSGREIPNVKSDATRGMITCSVRFDSRVRLNIETYVDGEYAGAMGHWGDVYTTAIAGPTRLYARATFTDGSYNDWGPVTVSCPEGGSYTWTLTHPRY